MLRRLGRPQLNQKVPREKPGNRRIACCLFFFLLINSQVKVEGLIGISSAVLELFPEQLNNNNNNKGVY